MARMLLGEGRGSRPRMSLCGCWIRLFRRMEDVGCLKIRFWLAPPGQMCEHCVWRMARTRSTQNRLQNWSFGSGALHSHGLQAFICLLAPIHRPVNAINQLGLSDRK